MTLSEHERRVLREMERSLTAEDPELVQGFGPVPTPWTAWLGLALALLGLGVALLAAGAVAGDAVLLAAGLVVGLPFPLVLAHALELRARRRGGW